MKFQLLFKCLFSSLLLLACSNLQAQLRFSWVNTYGATSGTDLGTYGQDVTVAEDTVYIVGGYTGNVDFDPSSGTDFQPQRGVGDVYVQKINRISGEVYWTKTIGSSQADIGDRIAVDSKGNVLFTGTYEGTIDLDPSSGEDIRSHTSGKDIFLVKLDGAGNYVWGQTWSASLSEYPTLLVTDENNNTYLAGRTDQNIDLDPGSGVVMMQQSASTYEAAFLVKLNEGGDYQWNYQIHGADHDNSRFTDMVIDPSGNLNIVGIAGGESNFDFQNETVPYAGLTNNFLLKIDADGNYINSDVFSGYSTSKLHIDAIGNVYLSGGRIAGRTPHDFDHGTGEFIADKDNGNSYLLKLDANWEFQWLRQIGPLNTSFKAITEDKQGNIIIGTTRPSYLEIKNDDETIFGPKNFPGQTNNILFVIALSPNGEYRWLRSLINTEDNALGNLKISDEGDYLLCGTFEKEQNFNPVNGGDETRTATLDREDAFITRWEPCIAKDTSIIIQTCDGDSALSPSGDRYYTEQGNYIDTIPTIDGCDSIINIGFYFYKYYNLYQIEQCEPYVHHDGTVIYTNTLFEEGPFVSSQGCDSVARWSIRINGNYFFDSLEVCTNFIAPDGSELTETGDYEITLKNRKGCDSTYYINLTVYEQAFHTEAIKVCESFQGPDGNTYTETGSLNFFLETKNGCDSLLIIDLEVIEEINTKINQIGNTLVAEQEYATYQWYDCTSNQPISGATTIIFNPENNGAYKVLITLSDCSAESDCSDFIVGVDEFQGEIQFTAYPNPTTSLVFLSRKGDYSVFNSQGKLLKTLINTQEIDLSDYPKGLYLIKLNDSRTLSIKVMKE